jgi:hypothetical protein
LEFRFGWDFGEGFDYGGFQSHVAKKRPLNPEVFRHISYYTRMKAAKGVSAKSFKKRSAFSRNLS